mmetsp:Transcript_7310/g.13865  ORF Transcript_7310/g.13865 Transcript_7310/m.13865 type:complete len:222 (+) Transcript_7310:819-1484(+)
MASSPKKGLASGPCGLCSPVSRLMSTICEPIEAVEKHEGAWGCKGLPEMKLPAISVPPQISNTGLYPPIAESQWYSSGVLASPDDEKHLSADQSKPSIQPDCRHVAARLGTSPSCVTLALCTNRPNSRPPGPPSNTATHAQFNSAPYISHGPIIHPRLVGQHNTSRGRTSICAKASHAHRRGSVCAQGMAFGSPVVPLENMILVGSSTEQGTPRKQPGSLP